MTKTLDPKDLLVRIRITDQSGHSTLEQRLEEAFTTIAKEKFAQGKWAMVGAKMFQFESTGLDDTVGLLNDTIRLRELLLENADENGEVTVTLTGPLQGGAR
jgi:hypothetical protein